MICIVSRTGVAVIAVVILVLIHYSAGITVGDHVNELPSSKSNWPNASQLNSQQLIPIANLTQINITYKNTHIEYKNSSYWLSYVHTYKHSFIQYMS